jgi:hypothetical protein
MTQWTIHPIYFTHALKYVYRNPVKEEIALTAFDYPYSSLREIFGFTKPSIPLMMPLGSIRNQIPSNLWDFKNWIETPHSLEESEAIKKALRRKQFKLPLRRSTRRLFPIEHQI